MADKTLRTLNFLKIYSIILTIGIIALAFVVLKQEKANSFDEISVERINVVEADGSLKLVISNSERQHNGIINGRSIPKRERQAGLIFFNNVGDECGGLIYGSNEEGAGLVLSIDKFQEDQVMQLKYEEAIGQYLRKYGLQFWGYPKENVFNERMDAAEALNKLETPEEQKAAYLKMKEDSLLMYDRMFVGQNFEEEMGLFINDENGKPRIRIFVDKNNQAKIEVLDEEGNVVEF